jgi:homoserine acetyltransferase
VPEELSDPAPFAPEFAVQSYLETHARRFVRAFDPNCYLYISRAMDRFDLAAHGGSNRAALLRSGVEQALVIGVESDMLFAIAEQRALAASFSDAGIATHFAPLTCIEGHDSFLIDIASFGKEIRSFLALS